MRGLHVLVIGALALVGCNIDQESASESGPDVDATPPIEAVGVFDAAWNDEARTMGAERAPRRIPTTIWSSAEATRARAPAPYASGRLIDALIEAGYYGQDASVLEAWRDREAPADLAAPPRSETYPLVVFSHGGAVTRRNYSEIAAALVRAGYVVVVMEHPYGGFALGRDGEAMSVGGLPGGFRGRETFIEIVDAWRADMAFVIDRLAAGDRGEATEFAWPSFDVGALGVAGHSLGGAAALLFCERDERAAACIDLDGAPFRLDEVIGDAVDRPLLVLRSSPDLNAPRARLDEPTGRLLQVHDDVAGFWRDALEGREGRQKIRAYALMGAHHHTFSDAPYVMPDLLAAFGGRTGAPDMMVEAVGAAVAGFLDEHVKGEPGALEAALAPYPYRTVDLTRSIIRQVNPADAFEPPERSTPVPG